MYYNNRISVFDLDKYKYAIPDNYLRQIRLGELFAGTVLDLVAGEERTVAVYVMGIHGDWLEMAWVHFDARPALPIVFADIIRYIIRVERAQIQDELTGVFMEIHSDEVSDPDELRHVLMMAGLDGRESLDYIYTFTLGQVEEREFLSKAARVMEVVRLCDADDELLETIDNMIQNDERPTPVGLFVDWEDYLREESLICLKKGQPKGALLFSMKGEYIVMECAYVTDKMALSVMLGNALPVLEHKYGPEQKMLIPVVLKKTAEIVERLVPGAERGKIIEGIKWF